MLTVMERENRKIGRAQHAYHSLQFEVEDRVECGVTKQVRLSFSGSSELFSGVFTLVLIFSLLKLNVDS